MASALARQTGCIECDLVIDVPTLRPGENATCPRCGHLITTCRSDGLTRSLALAISALVLLVLANSFPFMALEAQGLEKVMTLPRTALELQEEGYVALAVLVKPLVGAVRTKLSMTGTSRSSRMLSLAARLIRPDASCTRVYSVLSESPADRIRV